MVSRQSSLPSTYRRNHGLVQRATDRKLNIALVGLEVGDDVLLRRFEADEEALRLIRMKLRRTDLTRARVNEIVERERSKLWKTTSKRFH